MLAAGSGHVHCGLIVLLLVLLFEVANMPREEESSSWENRQASMRPRRGGMVEV